MGSEQVGHTWTTKMTEAVGSLRLYHRYFVVTNSSSVGAGTQSRLALPPLLHWIRYLLGPKLVGSFAPTCAATWRHPPLYSAHNSCEELKSCMRKVVTMM